jgi:CRP-like cAMP-binding protein
VEKGAPVFLEGDSADFVGVVLSGAVQIVRDDYYGKRSVIAAAEQGELFAEAFSCAGIETMPVSAFALCDSRVMLLRCRRVLTVCSSACRFHQKLIDNLLRVVARKSLMLSEKIQLMSCKTTREKLMAYLLEQAKRRGSSEFVIPYDRQALADHLGVERSAMSAEIGKLKREGVIDTKGSRFLVKKQSDK